MQNLAKYEACVDSIITEENKKREKNANTKTKKK
jgi:hypothetical protein